ncbi:MAG: hypothetical protein ACK5T0_00380 [Vampirovibrionales bacterium]|jgi:hypothetical protein
MHRLPKKITLRFVPPSKEFGKRITGLAAQIASSARETQILVDLEQKTLRTIATVFGDNGDQFLQKTQSLQDDVGKVATVRKIEKNLEPLARLREEKRLAAVKAGEEYAIIKEQYKTKFQEGLGLKAELTATPPPPPEPPQLNFVQKFVKGLFRL